MPWTIDQSFKAYKWNDLKVGYSLKLDGENKPKKRRVIAKILKLDENIQYGFAMIKPTPTGCIKEYPSPSWLKFNLLLESVSLDDPIGHLFIVDIEFDKKNATEREFLYNEIFPPIIAKKNVLDADKRSTFQLLNMFDTSTEGKPKTYRCTPKSHATMFPPKFIPLYLENLRFLIKRAEWHVAKLYLHFTFEQAAFKKEFVLMNQTTRPNAKNNIEKDFFKLMNNANFGFDCRNNANNTKFESIIDEMSKISYIKKYYNLFDTKVQKFVRSEILEEQIKSEYEQRVAEVRDDDPFKNARLREIENDKNDSLDGVKLLKAKEKKSKKRKIHEIDTRIDNTLKNKKIKTMYDFDRSECHSIKSIVVKSSDTVKVISRFIKGKMLMFAKLSLKSFVYDMMVAFCFPDEKIREIYDFYRIRKYLLYQNLTDTDNNLLLFNFICDLECSVPKSEARSIIFECMEKSKIAKRLDVSDPFWKKVDMHDPKTKKVIGLYEVESLDNPYVCTIAVNPEEYFEKLKNNSINKKHKGVRHDTPGMDFESYANRITPLRSLDCQ